MRLQLRALIVGPHYFTDGAGTDRRSVLLAAWHSPRSVTWRWTLSWHSYRARGYRHNCGGSCAVPIPLAGSLCFAWQRPIWREAQQPAPRHLTGGTE
jgi:hypothetical protein